MNPSDRIIQVKIPINVSVRSYLSKTFLRFNRKRRMFDCNPVALP